MKATLLFDAARTGTRLPADVVQEMRRFRASLESASQIVWGEHCSECAYPSCYSACTYYTPKSDLNCRRFDKGIESLTSEPDLDLVQIQFRRWGKLEGNGPVSLHDPVQAAKNLKRDQTIEPLITAPVLPRRLAQGFVHRWNTRKSGRPDPDALPGDGSAFVVETWLDAARHAAPIGFTLTIVSADKTGDTLFQSPFDVLPGYARRLFPVASIARHVALDEPYLVQIEPVGDAPPVPIVFGLTEFARPREGEALTPWPLPAASKKSKTAKCVVWDLDETLWHGILAEDGIEGLTLRPEAVELIRTLDGRGILHSVASKNDMEPALAALKHFGVRDYFLFPQVGWGPKSTSVRQIAELLDIGTDTFVFIDDQPFERGEVSQNVPGVTVIDAIEVAGLADHPLFDVPATPEAARRRSMYQTEETRQATFQASGADYLDFLRDCRIELEIDTLNAGNLERIYELTQRTNQLNFSGARYERAELSALIGQAGRTHVLRCSDKFGDYGIIGFVIAAPDRAEIESFFMSCRVQRKRVEQALFEHLRKAWNAPAEMRARFVPTAKNGASIRLLESLGFERTGSAFVRKSDAPIPDADVVRLRIKTPETGAAA